jgi:hypothetical protein
MSAHQRMKVAFDDFGFVVHYHLHVTHNLFALLVFFNGQADRFSRRHVDAQALQHGFHAFA